MRSDLKDTVELIVKKYGPKRSHILSIFWDLQNEYRMISDEVLHLLADIMHLPFLDLAETRSFYHFFSSEHRGLYSIYLNRSVTSKMNGYDEVAEAFEKSLCVKMETVREDKKYGLFSTSCIGMADQEPAALINNQVFPNLTPEKVAKIVDLLNHNVDPNIVFDEEFKPHSQVETTIGKAGPVFFNDQIDLGHSVRNALAIDPLGVIRLIEKSGLRGRGGAGFPTGFKWSYCRKAQGYRKYVFANIDEGEPGTFKDRILVQHQAERIIEGMIIAGYAIGAEEGTIYLRGEYWYLKDHLNSVIERFRQSNLLGHRILDHNLNFDIKIKSGAGAYICGEESALIESAQGGRGEPRNRPPYPVQYGFKGRPTVVNNPETYAAASMILLNGAEWYRRLGTETSAGTKLLSVSGDCDRPGIYEVEFGVKISDVLSLVGANDAAAVQVGGPSGTFLSPREFERRVAFEDVPTGGSFIVFGKERDLVDVIKQNMEFFVDESCGYCVPCRAGNTLLKETLDKVHRGFGTDIDLKHLKEWSQVTKATSRCGLGQSSPNTILSSLEYLPEIYEKILVKGERFVSQFDLSQSVASANKQTGRRFDHKE